MALPDGRRLVNDDCSAEPAVGVDAARCLDINRLGDRHMGDGNCDFLCRSLARAKLEQRRTSNLRSNFVSRDQRTNNLFVYTHQLAISIIRSPPGQITAWFAGGRDIAIVVFGARNPSYIRQTAISNNLETKISSFSHRAR
jgi:hypothetical protein